MAIRPFDTPAPRGVGGGVRPAGPPGVFPGKANGGVFPGGGAAKGVFPGGGPGPVGSPAVAGLPGVVPRRSDPMPLPAVPPRHSDPTPLPAGGSLSPPVVGGGFPGLRDDQVGDDQMGGLPQRAMNPFAGGFPGRGQVPPHIQEMLARILMGRGGF